MTKPRREPPPERTALVIDPDPARSGELRDALAELGALVVAGADADEGWRRFAERRPDLVIAAIGEPGRGGAAFLRRLNSEYMGAMPAVYLLGSRDEVAGQEGLEPDGFLVPPIARSTLRALFWTEAGKVESDIKQATRLRELFELTLLGTQLRRSLDALVARASLSFQADDCVMWGGQDERYWPRSARPVRSEVERQRLLEHCQLASQVGGTLHATAPRDGDGVVVARDGQSFLAVRLGDEPTGGMCLVSDGARRFSHEERDALRVLARRVAAELTWVSAHQRLLLEHESLREAALLDPLLGVWNRTALEQGIATQIQVAARRDEPLALAVLDFVQLRAVNERHGHRTGDGVLAHLAQTIRGHLRSQDQIGRFGGDEIAILLVGADTERARRALEHVLTGLAQHPFRQGALTIPLVVSVGLTPVLADETTGEHAFARALTALRRARRSPGAILVTDPGDSPVGEHSDVVDLGTTSGLPAGSTLGGMYRVLHEISRGAMGVVYRGEDLGLGRPVAIKVLRSDLSSDTDLVTRFRNEAALLAQLRHRNLVQVYAFGAEGEDVYFVMELVEGEPLSDVISKLDETGHHIGHEAMAKIVEEIADALEAIHALGIIHRDVKPANVLLDRVNDRAVLVDVGVAKRKNDAPDAAGTPGFAAPESFMDVGETPSADVYGLAATAYAMLTGLSPFGGGELVQVVNRQLYDRPAAPSELRPELSDAVDEVLLKALSPAPEDRYGSAGAFAIALGRALAREAAPRAWAAPIEERARTTPEHDTVSFGVPPLELGERAVAACRGVHFRVAYKVLGQKLGTPWLRQLAAASPELGELLKPNLAAMSWHPLGQLVELLQRTVDQVDDPARLAAQLGRATMTATLPRFFGADPAPMGAGGLVKAAEAFWARYHNWGHLTVEEHPTGATVTVRPGCDDALLCALIEGALGRIAELGGGREVASGHPDCATRGASACRFELGWA